jgi:hypothetical protein
MNELNEAWQKISTDLYSKMQPEATVEENQGPPPPSDGGEAQEIQFEEVKE